MAKILIVEDDSNLREAYINVLEIDGHSLVGVESVSEAIESLSRVTPDVVFLDMQLLDGSGRAVLSFIHRVSCLSHTKIVVVSGYVDLRAQAVRNWGADSFLAKPFTVADLKFTLSNLNISRASA